MVRLLYEPTEQLRLARSTRWARFWRVTRRDGVVLRITDHDRPVFFEDDTYSPVAGAGATNIRQQAGLAETNADVLGVISDDRISNDDLRAGRYRDATITEKVANWRWPFVRPIVHNVYTIGDVEFDGVSWRCEVVGKTQQLRETIGAALQRECRWELGGPLCYNPVAGDGVVSDGHPTQPTITIVRDFTIHGCTVSSVVSRSEFDVSLPWWNISSHIVRLPPDDHWVVTPAHGLLGFKIQFGELNGVAFTGTDPNGSWNLKVIDATTFEILGLEGVTAANGGTLSIGAPEGHYQFGRAIWVGPANNNFLLTGRIRSNSVSTGLAPSTCTVVLEEPMPHDIEVGDAISIEAGCDGLTGTCKTKFENFINYGGEEDLPGTDRIIQTPDQA